MSYDNWKLSNPIDDAGDSVLVSSCCGDTYEEDVMACGDCGSLDIKNLSKGDEFWSVCQECNSVENEYYIDYVCDKCDDECDAIPLYEYKENERDRYYDN